MTSPRLTRGRAWFGLDVQRRFRSLDEITSRHGRSSTEQQVATLPGQYIPLVLPGGAPAAVSASTSSASWTNAGSTCRERGNSTFQRNDRYTDRGARCRDDVGPFWASSLTTLVVTFRRLGSLRIERETPRVPVAAAAACSVAGSWSLLAAHSAPGTTAARLAWRAVPGPGCTRLHPAVPFCYLSA